MVKMVTESRSCTWPAVANRPAPASSNRVMRPAIALFIALFVAGAVPDAIAKSKSKQKEKRYDLVTLTDEKAAEGNYRGIEDSHILELRTAPGGFVGTLRYRGTSATLTDVSVTTRQLMATVNWRDGKRETLRGRFVNRVRNGVARFGLLTSGLEIPIEGVDLTNVFFERVSP